MTNKFLSGAALIALCWSACSEPTTFGSGLLEDQLADLAFTDTFSLQFVLEREDSLLTSDRSSVADYFLCGRSLDPFFGTATADIYTLMQLSTLSPDWSNATLDSIVMFVRYDAFGVYGDTLQPHTLRVHRLAEAIQNTQAYYSTNTLPIGEEIGKLTDFLPTPRTTQVLFDSAGARAAYLRIPLSQGFGESLLGLDSLRRSNDTAFYAWLNGFRLSVEPASAPGAMLAFDMNDVGFSFVRMYYTQNDTVRKTFDFYFRGTNKFVSFQHDYTGMPVEPLIGQPLDQLLYLQGMTGLRVKMLVPWAHLLDDVAINKAELLLTVAEQSGDFASLLPANQLVFTQRSEDGTFFVFNSDVNYALGPASLQPGFLDFGGFPYTDNDQGTELTRYKMTLSANFQDMIESLPDSLGDRTVFLNVYTQLGSARRSILYGPAAPAYAPKLSVKYTLLP